MCEGIDWWFMSQLMPISSGCGNFAMQNFFVLGRNFSLCLFQRESFLVIISNINEAMFVLTSSLQFWGFMLLSVQNPFRCFACRMPTHRCCFATCAWMALVPLVWMLKRLGYVFLCIMCNACRLKTAKLINACLDQLVEILWVLQR